MAGARPNYGVDAPGLVRGFLSAGVTAVTLIIVSTTLLTAWSPWQLVLAILLGIVAVYTLGMGVFMIYYSKFAKVRQRESLLDLIAWRGDEQVLDVGCGRGLMLVGAARRLPTGVAIGIDIWQASDQSDNSAAGALSNAAIEGVAERVRVQTADMRDLPFTDDAFDAVVSHWAVHNVEPAAGRRAALGEMVRVLKPGGTIILSDIINRDEYRLTLTDLGLTDQRLIVDLVRDVVLRTVSFGSFQPATIVARLPRL